MGGKSGDVTIKLGDPNHHPLPRLQNLKESMQQVTDNMQQEERDAKEQGATTETTTMHPTTQSQAQDKSEHKEAVAEHMQAVRLIRRHSSNTMHYAAHQYPCYGQIWNTRKLLTRGEAIAAL